MIELPQECIEDYLNGVTFEDLEFEYGISIMTIRDRVKKLGIYYPRTSHPCYAAKKIESRMSDIRHWYDSGMDIKTIARRVGVSYTTMLNKIKELGIQKKEPSIASRARDAGLAVTTVYQRMRAGYTVEQALAAPITEFKNRRIGIRYE